MRKTGGRTGRSFRRDKLEAYCGNMGDVQSHLDLWSSQAEEVQQEVII